MFFFLLFFFGELKITWRRLDFVKGLPNERNVFSKSTNIFYRNMKGTKNISIQISFPISNTHHHANVYNSHPTYTFLKMVKYWLLNMANASSSIFIQMKYKAYANLILILSNIIFNKFTCSLLRMPLLTKFAASSSDIPFNCRLHNPNA